MRIVLFEWCTAGGPVGRHEAISSEGRMMLESLAADVARDPALEPVVIVARHLPVTLPGRARILPVSEGTQVAGLITAAREAAWTVIVAPETDGILGGCVRAVRAAGGRVLAPAESVITVAADKEATIAALASRGIPVPAGRPLAAGAGIPPGFRLPAVRKRRDGCGGDGLEVVSSASHPAALVACRLEARAPGLPVGVSCLLGGAEPLVLPPVRQWFSAGERPRFRGGELLADESLADRARHLARRTATALGGDAGWLGVDLVLGDRPDGRDDRVLEVNPRVTTSFVLLARLFDTSLVAAMIAAATATTVPRLAAMSAGSDACFRLCDT